jgi:hypothetical protein
VGFTKVEIFHSPSHLPILTPASSTLYDGKYTLKYQIMATLLLPISVNVQIVLNLAW